VSRSRSGFAAAVAAVALSLVFTSTALATTWSGDRALTKSGGGYAYRGGLAVTGRTTVHAVFEQSTSNGFRAFYRRSGDSGTHWDVPIELSRPDVGDAGVPAIDAAGSQVDAVWVEGDDIFSGLDSVVSYRRSTDGGLTWQAPIQISSTLGRAGFPRVLHAGPGRVLVTWTDHVSKQILSRLSTNGGASFGSIVALGTTTDRPLNNGSLYDGMPTPALGSGVIYVAYYVTGHSLRIRRSIDGGVHWGTATTLATNGSGQDITVAAYGSIVLVGYSVPTSTDDYTVLRRSTDKGAHWAAPAYLSPKTAYRSFAPVITYRAGAFRAAFERCTTSTCSRSATYYRASSTGLTWGTTTAVSLRKRTYDYPVDIDVAGRIVVLYDDVNASSGDVYVRQGS